MLFWQVPDGLGGTELCKHLSAMNLSHQSSLDSVGEPPGPQTSIQYIMAAQGQMPSVNMPQQSYTMAQVNNRYLYTHAPRLAPCLSIHLSTVSGEILKTKNIKV